MADIKSAYAYIIYEVWGFPSGSEGKESACNCRRRVQSLGWEDPLRREWQPTPAFLRGKFHGQSSMVGYTSWVAKESDTTE